MGTVQFSDNRFTCIYCFKSHASPSGTGVDVECCGEIGHVEELMEISWSPELTPPSAASKS